VNRLWNGLLALQKTVMVMTTLAVTFIMVIAVVFRYVIKTDLFGSEEIVAIIAAWMYFMGSAYGSYEKSQITADIMTSYVKSEKVKQLIVLISEVLSSVICVLVTYWALQFFLWSLMRMPRSAIFKIPLIIPQGAVLTGFCLMSFYSIYHLLNEFGKFCEITNNNGLLKSLRLKKLRQQTY